MFTYLFIVSTVGGIIITQGTQPTPVRNPFSLPRKQVLSLLGHRVSHHFEPRTERKKEAQMGTW